MLWINIAKSLSAIGLIGLACANSHVSPKLYGLMTQEINFERVADERAVTAAILSPVLFPRPAKQKAFTRM
jgi:hypothetical protein